MTDGPGDSIGSAELGDGAKEIVLSAADAPFAVDTAAIPPSDLASSFRRLVLLYDLGRQIWGETEDQDVFEAILSAVSELLDVERAFIALVVGGSLVPRRTYGIVLTGEVDQWPVSTTMLRRVLQEGVTLLATDAVHDAQYAKVRSIDLHNIRSVMCCPLGTHPEPKGLIYVDNRLSSGAFSRADLEFLRALSHYALLAIENSEQRSRMSSERELAEARYDALSGELAAGTQLVGVSSAIVELYGQTKRVARTDIPVMVVGETGTGKEVFARLIHECSPRAGGPFVAVHVGSLSKAVVESELFGHEKGAFTGADRRRVGRFELASGGTLFLDEVLDIPLDVQPKLLRVLEQRTLQRVGGNEVVETDVRILCACNKSPELALQEGLFREDLYYRLNSVTLEIPALRERREDIVPLLHYFLEQFGSDKAFDEQAIACLKAYEWPGNVRELKNCVQALDALVDAPVVRRQDLPARMRADALGAPGTSAFEPLSDVLAHVEREHILRAFEVAGGNNEEAIRLLGISRAKYFQRKKLYGVPGKAPPS